MMSPFVFAATNIKKLPNCGRSWGVNVRSDIQVYLDVLELVHSAAGGEGVEVLFRVLNRYREGSETLVIVMGHCCRAYCGVNLDIPLGMASKFF